MTIDEKEAWIGLNMIKGLGPRRIKRLVTSFNGAQKVWHNSVDALARVVGSSLASQISHQRLFINPKEELAKTKDAGWQILTPIDHHYPAQLHHLIDPPAALYCWGQISQARGVALVGTRQPTQIGRILAESFGLQLAQKNIVIISGLARGIDSYAHWGALKGKGSTWAILGSALDELYPPEHKKLAKMIAQQNGCILSEYPLGTKPHKGHFPARNRLISGLAQMVVVVEAPIKSGALITVDAALEQGKEVGALPSNLLNSQGEGCNLIIQQGAKLIQSVDDILHELVPSFKEDI